MDKKKLAAVKGVLKRNIVSVLEYQRYDKLITIFVVNKIDFKRLAQAEEILQKENFIILHEDDIKNGSDIFPLQFLSIKRNSKLISGTDYFSRLGIKKRDVRSKLEFELRNKLIYLREQYLQSLNKEKFLLLILPAFVVLMEGLLFLKSKKPKKTTLENIELIEEIYEVDLFIFKKLYQYENKEMNFEEENIPEIEESFLYLLVLQFQIHKVHIRQEISLDARHSLHIFFVKYNILESNGQESIEIPV